MKRPCFSLLSVLFLFLAERSLANDIIVSNVSTVIEEANTFIRFDLSWKNSWRTTAGPANYDAAWIFVKYKDNDGVWKHLQLNGSHNNPGAAYTLIDTNDGLGYFIFRSSPGAGDISISNIRLGAETIPGDYPIKVFAIEMVYIPQSGFSAGDGDGSSYSAGSLVVPTNQHVNITTSLVQDVTSEGGFDDNRLDNLGIGIDGDGGLDTNNDGIIDNPLYPTGYKGFYCMKYEISQRALIDFLNTLTLAQQDFLETDPMGGSSPGLGDIMPEALGIAASQTPAIFALDADGDMNYNEPEDNEWSAARDMDWKQMAAYLDWAALRPMTDLEFEKICRGPGPAVVGEYVWGTTDINLSPFGIVNPLTSDEAVTGTDPDGNANYNGMNSRILRCGIFADGTTDRKSAGAAFYGPMEMGGNVPEAVVSLGNVAGRSFTGKPGDGILTVQGFANEDHWPGINGNDDPANANGTFSTGVSKAAGIGLRGGDYADGEALLRLSNRQHATIMSMPVGGRGVRQND